MKITFTTAGWGLSGGDRVIAIYAERLQKRGHQVLLVAPGERKPGFVATLKHWAKNGGRAHHRSSVEPTHLDPAIPRIRLSRWRPVEDQDVPDADVVVATWWETAEWVAKLSPAKGAKTIFLQHHEAFEYVSKARVDDVWRLPFHKITISKWLIELARTQFGDGKASLIFNSVDSSQFYAPPRDKNATPTVGILYSDIYWKGTDVCLEAIRRLPFAVKVIAFSAHVERPDVGGFPKLPEGSLFYYRPEQHVIRELYAACDVWLCGSRGEGFHLPPLEAMACRCPVVSTAVGGPIDIIEDGFNGYVVPIDDVDALTDRLRHLCSLSPTAWRSLSDNALSTALRYTWDDATDLFEKALELAVKRRANGETA